MADSMQDNLTPYGGSDYTYPGHASAAPGRPSRSSARREPTSPDGYGPKSASAGQPYGQGQPSVTGGTEQVGDANTFRSTKGAAIVEPAANDCPTPRDPMPYANEARTGETLDDAAGQ